ncbi:hypothetical protein LLG95_13070 [bacterium]|nr:hypothetical protein [bacterium]
MLRIRSSCFCVVILLMIGCGNNTPPPTPPAATPVSQPTSEATPISTENSKSDAKTYTYDQLKLVNGNGIVVQNEMRFGARFANEPKYINVFKFPFTDMNTQVLTIDGTQMQITYIDFADSETAGKALANAKSTSSKSVLIEVGNWVVSISCGAAQPDPTTLKKASDQIEANANKS